MVNQKKIYIKNIKGDKKTCKLVEKCTTVKKKSKKKTNKSKKSSKSRKSSKSSKSRKSSKSSKSNKSNKLIQINNNSDKFKYMINSSNKNEVVTNNKILDRINNLKIPPAYKDVKISNDKNSYLQAVGIDDKGRKQYIYHPNFIKKKEEEKYNNVIRLGKKMKEIKKDLKHKIKKMANQKYQNMEQPEANINIILNLLVNNNFRIGSKKYADKYKSYGASTLKNDHLSFKVNNKSNTDSCPNENIEHQQNNNENNKQNNNCNQNKNYFDKNNKLIKIKFVGKKGVINEDIVSDSNMINVLNKVKQNQKQYLFMYPGHDGNNHLVSNEQISQALQKYHSDLTPKMIRTWRANTHFLEKLRKDHKEKNSELGKLYKKEKNKYIKLCCDHVSNKLHNTPAITKKSYLDHLLVKKVEEEPKKIMKIIHNESNKRLSEDELLVQLLKKIGRKIL